MTETERNIKHELVTLPEKLNLDEVREEEQMLANLFSKAKLTELI